MNFLAVKNFERFQHYKDRAPIWIKLYTSVLRDAAFLNLPEAGQAQLVKLWVLASQVGNPLPNDPKFLGRSIFARGVLRLDPLIEAGFLIPCDSNTLDADYQRASTALARARDRARGEVEVEGETEKRRDREEVEEKATTTTTREALLATVPNRIAWEGEFRAMTAGMAGHLHATDAQLDAAITDYVANNDFTERRPSMGLFKGYVKSAISQNGASVPLRPHPSTSNDTRTLVATILSFRGEHHVPGGGVKPFIPKARVTELGPDIELAYDAIGGADRFLSDKPDARKWLARDFGEALAAAQKETATITRSGEHG